MPKLPERLGSLTLVQQLGLGKHCQVWEATTKAGDRVAVKVIVPEMASDAGQRQLLEHELKVATSLAHPTVIRIDRLSEEGGLPHLVMELFPALNLKKQIAAGVDDLVPKLLKLTQLAHRDRVAEVQVGRARIVAAIDLKRFAGVFADFEPCAQLTRHRAGQRFVAEIRALHQKRDLFV